MSHSYTIPGKYVVTLIVNNGRDNSEPSSTTVEVLPSSISRNSISFDSSCTDPGTNITISGYKYDGDGGWDFSDGPFPPHMFESEEGPFYISGGDRFIFRLISFKILPTFPDFSFHHSVTIPSNVGIGNYSIHTNEERFPSILTIPCPKPDNSPPLANAGGPYFSDINTPVSFDGSKSNDLDGDSLNYFWDFGDSLNSTSINPQHLYNNPGEYIASLTVYDSISSSKMPFGFANVTITNVSMPVNNPPIAEDVTTSTEQNIPIEITLQGIDIDNDPISFQLTTSPSNGLVSNFDKNLGTLIYIPNTDFFGSDSFTFKVIDSQGLESTESAVVSINVKKVIPPPVNNPPVAVDKTMETNSNTPVRITLEGRDIDQGDTINSFTIISNPTNGQISNFNSNMGTLTYTPNNNFAGQDSFTFKVTDSRGLQSTNIGVISITAKSPPPPNNEQPPLPLPSSVCTDSNNDVKPKGTQSNDELVGTSQRDTITGLGGNDRFNGCSGDDTLNGNSGNDGIDGGPDDDNLHGNEGNDYLQGDTGSDSLYGNEGNDIFIGNEDRDRFFCGSGNDKILDFDYPLDVKSNDCEEF